jgi:CPA1 family monovalent cation:H+ antiporter
MDLANLASVLITLTALFAYLGARYTSLPTTIAVMVISLAFSILLVFAHLAGFAIAQPAIDVIALIDFDKTLFHGMLSFLLFAGALHIDSSDLLRHRISISLLATVGVVISCALVACGLYLVAAAVGQELSFAYCLVFGALIAPTDAVAIMALLRASRARADIRATIVGESLFNDGMAVVLFTVTLSFIVSRVSDFSTLKILLFVFKELVGGVIVGLAIGWLAYQMIRSIDHSKVEILVSVAVATGGYALANALSVSGPIAMVCAGVYIGHNARRFGMKERNREQLDNFWELIDEILNAVLFVLIGLELVVLTYSGELFLTTLLCIPLVLASRWVSVIVPLAVLPTSLRLGRSGPLLLTWGGLRGGISVAMALSLPAGAPRDVVVAVTYGIVLFSVLVQGQTMPALVRKLSLP